MKTNQRHRDSDIYAAGMVEETLCLGATLITGEAVE